MDRRANPPFALRLFYRTGAFHRPDEFSAYELPPYLTIHTWPSCTLAELSHHLAFTDPSILPTPAIGTRLSFRLIYPDTRATGNSGALGQAPKYLVKVLGSVVIGHGDSGLDTHNPFVVKDLTGANGIAQAAGKDAGIDDASKTLADARLVIGDYVSVAILPPLENGSVAPASSARMGRGAGAGEAGTVVGRAPGFGGRERDHEFVGRRSGRGGRSDGLGRGGRGGSMPMGEWRRGEILPEVPRGDWRRGDAPSDVHHGRSRGRGRW